MKLVIKLFHEIVIKSRPVRKLLIKHLQYNLERILSANGYKAKVRRSWDKIEIEFSSSVSLEQWYLIKELLICVPGIDSILRIDQYPFETLDDILERCKTEFGASLKGKTFCIRAKRKGKHTFTSQDVERYLGGGLLHQTEAKGVQLNSPEQQIDLEIINENVSLIIDKVKGLGGYPLGHQESVLSLISGGYDSTVSSYMMMKRGVMSHYCFFNLGGVAHEIGVKQVAYYLWQKYGSTHKVRFISIPFEGVVEEILKSVDTSLMGVVLKRMMLRAAERVAEYWNIPALVTGEAIGQVSSQTLTNLKVIDESTNATVLRPLISMDKQDIIAYSRLIGTERYAATMPEFCGVISKRPSAKVKLFKVQESEQAFDFDVLEQAIHDHKMEIIDTVLDGIESNTKVETILTPDINDIIVDIRQPDEQQEQPLLLTNNKVLVIPFYSLKNHLTELKGSNRYLLYCGKGVMSQIQAHQLQLQGYDNIKVFDIKS